MNKNELAQIADILPPSVPLAEPMNTSIYIFVFVLFIAVAAGFFLVSRKQRLQRIGLRYQRNKINSRQCAFELSRLLNNTGKNNNNGSWQVYSQILQQACYSRDSLDAAAMAQLLAKTKQWL